MSLPRLSNGMPTASNSRLYQPEAMPMMKGPFGEMVDAGELFGETTGLARQNRTSAPILRAASVLSLIPVSAVSELMIGKFG